MERQQHVFDILQKTVLRLKMLPTLRSILNKSTPFAVSVYRASVKTGDAIGFQQQGQQGGQMPPGIDHPEASHTIVDTSITAVQQKIKKEMAMCSVMLKSVTAAGTIAGSILILAGCAGIGSSGPGAGNMTFFVTSSGPGKGADLGGLEGADRHCQTLAQAAGAGQRTWRAYLSTQATALNDPNFVNARDRIGAGPWQNAKGVVIATSVENLHAANNLTKETALDERGQAVNGRTEKPNKHDILTGSRPDGTAFPGPPFSDMTCGNWTKSGPEGSAMIGHHDRAGPIDAPWAKSWNSAHPTRGCHPEGVRSTGGEGLLYCFAVK